jgi:hypothetical protein
MPAIDSVLFHWKRNQLSSEHAGLDYKIEKENELDEGATMWSDRKVRLVLVLRNQKATVPMTSGRSTQSSESKKT